LPPPPPPLAFPPIEYGGSLIVAWQLRNKRVLIVGGGEVAAGRLRNVLEADAFVTLIAPSSKLNPEVRFRISLILVPARESHITTAIFSFLPRYPYRKNQLIPMTLKA